MKKKCCWMGKEYRKGWRLSLWVGNKPHWLPFWFKSMDEIETALDEIGRVFVHLDRTRKGRGK